MVILLIYEEKELMIRLGELYTSYKEKFPFLFPWKKTVKIRII